MDRLTALIDRSSTLASLPDIYYKLSSVINNPSSSLKDIAEVIEKDPALMAQLLKIANSALFNFPSQVTTITQAITVVGIQQLKELTLACNVISAFPLIPKHFIDNESFWKHSLAVGVASRVIASYRKESNIERFYVLGLLHDIGRLVVFLDDPNAAEQSIHTSNQQQELLHKVEKRMWDYDHGEISSELLKHWKLPQSLWEPIRYHHAPDLCNEYPEEAAVIHLADILAHTLELGGSGEKRIPPLNTSAWERLGLDVSYLEGILKETEEQYDASVNLFSQRMH
jgi:HD-like signal output (HDOD) protein